MSDASPVLRHRYSRRAKKPLQESSSSKVVSKSRQTKSTTLKNKLRPSLSSSIDSGIDSPGLFEFNSPKQLQITEFLSESNSSHTPCKHKLKARSKINNSTPFGSKIKEKDFDYCFGFEELEIDDEESISKTKDLDSPWSSLYDHASESTSKSVMPDPGLSPIKENLGDDDDSINRTLFDESFDEPVTENLTKSSKTYTRHKRRVNPNALDELDVDINEDNIPKNKPKKPKLSKKVSNQIKSWEKKINLEFDEIDQFDLCIE